MARCYATRDGHAALCLPALGALKHLLLALPHLQRPATRTPDVALIGALAELDGVRERGVEDALRTVLRLAGVVGSEAQEPELLVEGIPRVGGSGRVLETFSL